MKLALNGALTIGTLDGANVEIRDLVGDDNFFLFGLTEPEVTQAADAGYQPRRYYESDPDLRRALDAIAAGDFSGGDRAPFAPLVDALLGSDYYMVLADYRSYIQAQDRAEHAYRNPRAWTRSAVLNVARCGFFSSDRSIRDYLDRVWHTTPVPHRLTQLDTGPTAD